MVPRVDGLLPFLYSAPEHSWINNKIDVTLLDQALQALESLDERQARIVELRFFAGLTVEETAELLEISPATVKRDWTLAKIWLRRELSAN